MSPSSRWPIDCAMRRVERFPAFGHDLGSDPQTISLARIDGDAKIRRLDDFRRHLTDDSRNMRLGKRVRLDDHGRPRLAVISCRRDDDNVTALHRCLAASRTRRPLRSNSKRRPHSFGRDERLRRPYVAGRIAGANRERQDAVRVNLASAAARASSSFVRQARASRSSPSATALAL